VFLVAGTSYSLFSHVCCRVYPIATVQSVIDGRITAGLRSFLLVTFPALLQLLVRVRDALKSDHELLDVVKTFVEDFLTNQH